MMNKVACIDIGTNSVRMILLDNNSNQCIESEKYMETTRIGSGVDAHKMLSEEAMQRTLDALVKFADIARAEGAEEILAIATSAVRDAGNRDVFLERVRQEAHIQVEMISGQEEARLGFLGVSKGTDIKGDILVIDIGGGSTELIVGRDGEIVYSISLDIGAVRMTDKFITSDPWDLKEQQDMADYIRKVIKEAIACIAAYDIKALVGIGGTISTAGSMALDMEDYDRKKIHNYYVPYDRIQSMNRKMMSMVLDDRKNIVGLQAKRADIIPAGFMILQLLLLALDKEGITISEYDNLEGLFFDKLYKKHF